MTKINKKDIERRLLEYSTIIPSQFYLLCKLIEKEPGDILYDFMNNVGMESLGLRDTQKTNAREYFISCEYGQDFYTEDDLRKIFKEMDSMGSLYPGKGGDRKLIDLHTSWRDKYHEYWFEKWFLKVRRKQ
ncbi:MAG: hypothetical protein E6Q24_20095 [Chitinophagaceae bacterium]|nr:MAG: hypothetical protein E6Q24_20095 [Chitinophagaceae bacterium]